MRRAHDLSDEVLGYVAAEHFQALAHALDGVGQAHDLGDVALDRHGVGEIEMADALGLGRQPRRRARHQERRHQHGEDRERDDDARQDRGAVEQHVAGGRQLLDRHSGGDGERPAEYRRQRMHEDLVVAVGRHDVARQPLAALAALQHRLP